jgi:hypothetical protein
MKIRLAAREVKIRESFVLVNILSCSSMILLSSLPGSKSRPCLDDACQIGGRIVDEDTDELMNSEISNHQITAVGCSRQAIHWIFSASDVPS